MRTMMRYTEYGITYEVPYSLYSMCHVILNELDYELQGRDY